MPSSGGTPWPTRPSPLPARSRRFPSPPAGRTRRPGRSARAGSPVTGRAGHGPIVPPAFEACLKMSSTLLAKTVGGSRIARGVCLVAAGSVSPCAATSTRMCEPLVSRSTARRVVTFIAEEALGAAADGLADASGGSRGAASSTSSRSRPAKVGATFTTVWRASAPPLGILDAVVEKACGNGVPGRAVHAAEQVHRPREAVAVEDVALDVHARSGCIHFRRLLDVCLLHASPDSPRCVSANCANPVRIFSAQRVVDAHRDSRTGDSGAHRLLLEVLDEVVGALGPGWPMAVAQTSSAALVILERMSFTDLRTRYPLSRGTARLALKSR